MPENRAPEPPSMSTIDPRLCFPHDHALLQQWQWRQREAAERRRTGDETEGLEVTAVAAEPSPTPWPVFTADEDRAMRGQLLEQDAAGDWLGIVAQEAGATMPSSPQPTQLYPNPPGEEAAVGTVARETRLDIGGFAPLTPANDWRSLAAPAWQGPPPRKVVETGWYPYVVPWSAYLYVGAWRPLPDEIEAVLPSSAAPASQEGGGLPVAAVATTAPRKNRDPAPVVHRPPPPLPPPVVVREMPPPPPPVYVVRDTPPPPPPLLPVRMTVVQPAPGLPPRHQRYVPRTPPAIQAPSRYQPVGHHGVSTPPPYLAPPVYRPPTIWYDETAPGEWWDPRMPAPAPAWTGPRRLRDEQRGRVCFRE